MLFSSLFLLYKEFKNKKLLYNYENSFNTILNKIIYSKEYKEFCKNTRLKQFEEELYFYSTQELSILKTSLKLSIYECFRYSDNGIYIFTYLYNIIKK